MWDPCVSAGRDAYSLVGFWGVQLRLGRWMNLCIIINRACGGFGHRQLGVRDRSLETSRPVVFEWTGKAGRVRIPRPLGGLVNRQDKAIRGGGIGFPDIEDWD